MSNGSKKKEPKEKTKMKIEKRKIDLGEFGEADVEMHGNSFITFSLRPSDIFVEKIAPRLRKTLAILSKDEIPPNTHTENKALKQPYFGSYGHSFSDISKEAMEHIRGMKFKLYSEDLAKLAEILKSEDKRTDELKLRMMKFHIDLSGTEYQPMVDWVSMGFAIDAVEARRMSEDAINELFFDTIRPNMTPEHAFTVKGSNRMFWLGLARKERKMSEILNIAIKYWKSSEKR